MCMRQSVIVLANHISACLKCQNLLFCCSRVIDMRNRHKEAFLKKHGIKLGFMSPFVKAATFALQDQPVVNAGKCV